MVFGLMHLVRRVQKQAEPYPVLYKFLLTVYGLCGEVYYLVHAVLSGKLKARITSSRWSRALSRQRILYRAVSADAGSLDRFRNGLNRRGLRFLEGGWTLYIPPQEAMDACFGFLKEAYPPGVGLKVLKNLEGPDKARYTKHRQHPGPGLAIMRSLTPSPVALIRIANYLYWHGLGIRIHDIVGLTCRDRTLTCYVVEHVNGKVTKEEDYRAFMDRMQAVLDAGDLTTAHARVDIIEDLMPPDCNANLRLRPADGRPLYVDFQGFLFRNEDRVVERVLREAGPRVRFDIEETGRGRDPVWEVYRHVLEGAGCSLEGRPVLEVGCSAAFVAYEALAAGASWVLGWYPPDVRGPMEHLLLTLGATRFDLFPLEAAAPTGDVRLARDLPRRFVDERKGVLFTGDANTTPGGASVPGGPLQALPWEYALFEGRPGFPLEAELVDSQRRVGPGGTETEVLLFRRDAAGWEPHPERTVERSMERA